MRRIVITDRPSVLGLPRFAELDERYAFDAVMDTLRHGTPWRARRERSRALGHLLLGALVRGAMLVAANPTPRATRDAISRTIGDLLAGLAPSSSPPSASPPTR